MSRKLSKQEKDQHRNCFCGFKSHVTDQHDQQLLHGIFVDWNMTKDAAEKLEAYTPHHIVENAIVAMNQMHGTSNEDSAYHTMILPPVNELDIELELDAFPESLRQEWIDRKLGQHLKAHVSHIKDTIGKTEESDDKNGEENNSDADNPTLLLCNATNLVYLDDGDKMMVNPNIPTPDWFRCANYRLVENRVNLRVLPLLRQASSIDTVYGAVECISTSLSGTSRCTSTVSSFSTARISCGTWRATMPRSYSEPTAAGRCGK